MLLFFENFRLLFGPSTQKSRPFSSTDGFLRNVIALFYFLPVLQAPESLDITAFLIRTNHMTTSDVKLNSYRRQIKKNLLIIPKKQSIMKTENRLRYSIRSVNILRMYMTNAADLLLLTIMPEHPQLTHTITSIGFSHKQALSRTA